METINQEDNASHPKLTNPFYATNLWNDIVSSFRSSIKTQRHRYRFRFYDDCFSGQDAVTVIYKFLCKEREQLGNKIITREKAEKVCQLLFQTNIFESIPGFNFTFKDTPNKLYCLSNGSLSNIFNLPPFPDQNQKQNIFISNNNKFDGILNYGSNLNSQNNVKEKSLLDNVDIEDVDVDYKLERSTEYFLPPVLLNNFNLKIRSTKDIPYLANKDDCCLPSILNKDNKYYKSLTQSLDDLTVYEEKHGQMNLPKFRVNLEKNINVNYIDLEEKNSVNTKNTPVINMYGNYQMDINKNQNPNKDSSYSLKYKKGDDLKKRFKDDSGVFSSQADSIEAFLEAHHYISPFCKLYLPDKCQSKLDENCHKNKNDNLKEYLNDDNNIVHTTKLQLNQCAKKDSCFNNSAPFAARINGSLVKQDFNVGIKSTKNYCHTPLKNNFNLNIPNINLIETDEQHRNKIHNTFNNIKESKIISRKECITANTYLKENINYPKIQLNGLKLKNKDFLSTVIENKNIATKEKKEIIYRTPQSGQKCTTYKDNIIAQNALNAKRSRSERRSKRDSLEKVTARRINKNSSKKELPTYSTLLREASLSHLLTYIDLPLLDGIADSIYNEDRLTVCEDNLHTKTSIKHFHMKPEDESLKHFNSSYSLYCVINDRCRDLWWQHSLDLLEQLENGQDLYDECINKCCTSEQTKLHLINRINHSCLSRSEPAWPEAYIGLQIELYKIIVSNKPPELSLKCFQLAMGILDEKRRNYFKCLLNFMQFSSEDNTRFQIKIGTANRATVLDLFSPCVIRNKTLNHNQICHVVSYLIDCGQTLWSFASEVKATAKMRMAEISGRLTIHERLSSPSFTRLVSPMQYDSQMKRSTEIGLIQMIDSILDSTSLSLKEKKRLFKEFYKCHPGVYYKYFGEIVP